MVLVAVLTVLGALARPADALAVSGPASSTQSGGGVPMDDTVVTASADPPPGHLDLAMTATVVVLVGAIGGLCACRPRLAQERAVRRFRSQLRSVDVVSQCR